jgi:hypothetical protein
MKANRALVFLLLGLIFTVAHAGDKIPALPELREVMNPLCK